MSRSNTQKDTTISSQIKQTRYDDHDPFWKRPSKDRQRLFTVVNPWKRHVMFFNIFIYQTYQNRCWIQKKTSDVLTILLNVLGLNRTVVVQIYVEKRAMWTWIWTWGRILCLASDATCFACHKIDQRPKMKTPQTIRLQNTSRKREAIYFTLYLSRIEIDRHRRLCWDLY